MSARHSFPKTVHGPLKAHSITVHGLVSAPTGRAAFRTKHFRIKNLKDQARALLRFGDEPELRARR